jgi:anaerobic selenocysteine-containing dehydrogenase
VGCPGPCGRVSLSATSGRLDFSLPSAGRNPDYPLTKGRLCASGDSGVDFLYDPDILKSPILLQGIDMDALAAQLQKEGAESFVKSWDEMMDVVAKKAQAYK